MLSKNILKKSVESTSETTKRNLLKKETPLSKLYGATSFRDFVIPHIRSLKLNFKCFTWWLPKAKMESRKNQKFRTWKSSLAKQIPSLNFGGVHIEIFRSPPRLYSSFQLTSDTKMDKFLQKIFGAEKKKEHIFPLWQTQPLENQNKRTQQNKTTEKLEILYIYTVHTKSVSRPRGAAGGTRKRENAKTPSTETGKHENAKTAKTRKRRKHNPLRRTLNTNVVTALGMCMYRSSPSCSTLNMNVITALGMRKVCTEAVHSVALWTRTLSQLWACVKYVPKQSIP